MSVPALVSLFEKKTDFLKLCDDKVRCIEVLVNSGNLLNRRQCQDLSKKLSKTTLNIRHLVLRSVAQADGLSRPNFDGALEHLYRYLEKAIQLVRNCGKPDWCAEAVFQCQNENAFRHILLEVGFCYNAIYEVFKSTNEDQDVQVDDLRESSEFLPATDSDILEDQQDLQKRLEDIVGQVDGHSLLAEEVALKRSLAKYLLVKMQCTSEQSMPNALDKSSEILWQKDKEPPGTWGESHFLGVGATDGAVCRTHWLGIPCAKKAYHWVEHEHLFLKEAGILAHLNHPCIVNFVCCSNGEGQGDRFIAMELMEKSLAKVIEDQKNVQFSLPVVVDIVLQIAQGMWYLHDNGVSHRDLKPQNVVVKTLTYPETTLENHFAIKLVDFGESKTNVEVLKSNTMTYRGIGTTMYRAPEAHPSASSGGIGRVNWFKADVFSFAMTCAHILSLEVRFQGKKKIELGDGFLYEALMNGHRPDLPKDCPEELATLLKDCWNTLRQKRPSFKDICKRLEIFKHKVLIGSIWKKVESKSLDFIEEKIEAHSSLQKVFVNQEKDDEAVDEAVAIISCDFGHKLELLPQPPYIGGFCNVCDEALEGSIYHCHICCFDAHPHCAGIKSKVNVIFHHHPLHLLVEDYYSNDPESLSCGRCNGRIQAYSRRYTCIDTANCEINLHPFCATKHGGCMCIFDSSHMLFLLISMESFSCAKCGAPTFRWSYYCNYCKVYVHPDCVDGMHLEKIGSWNAAHEKFMIEKERKDDHTKMKIISQLLDSFPFNDAPDASSSSSSSPPLAVTSESLDSNSDEASVQGQTEERIKARKMAAKESGQKLRANLPKTGECFERMILDLQRSQNIADDEIEVAAVLERLKRKLDLLKEQVAMQGHSKMSQGPRIAVFYKERVDGTECCREILTSIEADIKEVYFNLLCEKPGHEHIVPDTNLIVSGELGEIIAERLKPLVAPGLQVVMKAARTSEFIEWDSVTLPCLEPPIKWGLRPIQPEVYGIQGMDLSEDKEKVEMQNRAQDSAAEWLRNGLESQGRNMWMRLGLQRIRFKVTEEAEFPKYRRGTLAWLCTDHVNSGVEDGTLETYPLKYFDVEDDYQLRWPTISSAEM